MKRIRIPASLLIGITAILSTITIFFNILSFYSSVSLDTWDYINETLNVIVLFILFLYLKTRPLYSENNVQKNLKNFIKSLALLYIIILLSKQIFNPLYSSISFPQRPESLLTVVYSSIATLTSIVCLSIMIIAVKNLINYRRKKRTKIYFAIALIFGTITVVLTVIFKIPLELNFEGTGLYNNGPFLITLIFLFFLAVRNSWITFLSRTEKFYYFLVGIILVWVIFILFDFAFEVPVASHSLALGVIANLGWFFLVFYSILATAFLMLQLPTARVFDRKIKEVTSLYNLSRTITVEFDHDKLVQMVTDMSSEVIESSFTWLEIYDEKDHLFHVAASKNLSDPELNVLRERQKHIISEKIIANKQTYLINDIYKSEVKESFKEWKKHIGSFAGVPLLSSKSKVFGILYAAKSEVFGFDPDDVNLMEAYASQAAIAIENAQLVKVSLERERMEKELQIAREVQLRLLPQNIPKLLETEIETLTITAYEVGGDYYDFYGHSDSKFGMVIGDVSGKGTSAAFYMAETKGIIQSLARSYDSPRDILIHTNKLLYSSMERKTFISLLTAKIDLKDSSITFARAGHCPIIHYNAEEQQTHLFQSEGIAVGLDAGEIFDKSLEECRIKLSKNDVLAFYTDGLSEARNKNGDEFGEDRLCDIIRSHPELNAAQLKEIIIDRILEFLGGQNLHDDLTLILIKI